MKEPELTPVMTRILEIATLDAKHQKCRFVGIEHFLNAIHKEGKNLGALILDDGGITLKKLRTLR